MQKLLTIAIPTYDRARLLDKQMAWLATEIAGYEAECEIAIYDNCSTDDTPQVIGRWQSSLSPSTTIIYHRNSYNIGGMPNLITCMRSATGRYVWTLGDDDPIREGTLAFILNTLKRNSNLTLILLNGDGRDRTGKIVVDRLFDRAIDTPTVNSRSDIEYFLDRNMGGALFISAAIYRTDLLHNALKDWQDAGNNLASQAYFVGRCAAEGSFIVTSGLYTECAMGSGYADQDPQWTFKMEYMYIPQVYLKLMQAGYSKTFCISMILKNVKKVSSWKILLGGFRRWFLFASKGFSIYLSCMAMASWLMLSESKSQPSK